jgi:hypothetical protein
LLEELAVHVLYVQLPRTVCEGYKREHKHANTEETLADVMGGGYDKRENIFKKLERIWEKGERNLQNLKTK